MSDCHVSEVILDLLESCWDDEPNERPRDALALAQALEREQRDPVDKRLARWRASDAATVWVNAHPDGWTRAQLLAYVAEIKGSEFGPLPENEVALHFDQVRNRQLQKKLQEHQKALEAERQQKEAEIKKLQADYENRLRPAPAVPPPPPPVIPVPQPPATPKNTAPQPGSIFTNSLDMKFAWVPPGKFLMGSPTDEKDRSNDENQVQVQISKGFYLGVYTVTVGQFERFVKATGYQSDAELSSS